MKKAIIFDAYGTLISTGNGSIIASKKILKKINFDMDSKEFYKKWKELHKKQMRELNTFITEKEIFENDLKMLYEYYGINHSYKEDIKIMLETLEHRNVFLETNEALEELSKKYEIYIGSVTDTNPLLKNIKDNNIKVNGIYTSEMLKTYKPQKEFYIQILKQLNLEPKDVIFVGDSLEEDIKRTTKCRNFFYINRQK